MEYFDYENKLNTQLLEEINSLKNRNTKCSFLLVGAKGFIGSNFFDYFFPLLIEYNLNLDLFIITRNSYFQAVFNGSKFDWKLIKEIPLGITHIFHLAVSSTPKSSNEFEKIELESYFNTRKKIDEICFVDKPYLIYLSSGSVFGRDSSDKHSNDYEINCIENLFKNDAYTYLKKLDESHFYLNSKFIGYPLVLINLYNVLLPNQLIRPHFAISQFIEAAVNSKEIMVKSPRTLRSYIGLKEIMLAFLLASNSKNDFLRFSLGSPLPISMIDLANCISNFFGNSNVSQLNINESSEFSIYYPKKYEIHPNFMSLSEISPISYISGLLKSLKIKKS